MSEIEIDVEDEEARRLWTDLGELVPRLPGEWVLIGGLMVQLHAVEHGAANIHTTRDIDVLVQARPQGALPAMHTTLEAEGFQLVGPDLDGHAHRYERAGLIIDVLAPDGMRPPPELGAGLKAVGVPGGSQALSRSEAVAVRVGGRSFQLRRPTLLGAILIKARSLMVHADPETQREDLLRLLSLIDDPREMSAELRKSERKWLRAAEQRLDFERTSSLDADSMRTAALAYRLLVRDP